MNPSSFTFTQLRNFFVLFFLLIMFGCNNDSTDHSINSDTPIEKELAIGDTLTIGSISNIVHDELLNNLKFINYLSDSLKEVGIGHVEIIVQRSINEMNNLVNKGKIDFYSDSPYPMSKIIKSGKMILFLKQYKAGVENYNGLIFVRKDSGIESVDELNGKLLGFDEPYSSSGFALPYILLLENGFKLNQIESIGSILEHEKINYTFTGDDENTMYWVQAGKIDAGVTDNISFLQYADASKAGLNIIFETEKISRYLVAVDKNLDKKVKGRLYSLLLDMHKTDHGKMILKSYFGTTKFDTLNNFDFYSLNKFDQI